MAVIIFVVLSGIAIAMFGAGAGSMAWGAFVAIGGFFMLCAIASDGM